MKSNQNHDFNLTGLNLVKTSSVDIFTYDKFKMVTYSEGRGNLMPPGRFLPGRGILLIPNKCPISKTISLKTILLSLGIV